MTTDEKNDASLLSPAIDLCARIDQLREENTQLRKAINRLYVLVDPWYVEQAKAIRDEAFQQPERKPNET